MSRDTLGTLRARIAALGDTWTDAQGTVHERPTAWAYAQACLALDRWRQRAEVAEAALREIQATTETASTETCTQYSRCSKCGQRQGHAADCAARVVGERDEAGTRHRWCRYAGPGRGDCSHFVGMPAEINHPKTVDVYGIPYGWCDYCWATRDLDNAPKVLVEGQEPKP